MTDELRAKIDEGIVEGPIVCFEETDEEQAAYTRGFRDALRRVKQQSITTETIE